MVFSSTSQKKSLWHQNQFAGCWKSVTCSGQIQIYLNPGLQQKYQPTRQTKHYWRSVVKFHHFPLVLLDCQNLSCLLLNRCFPMYPQIVVCSVALGATIQSPHSDLNLNVAERTLFKGVYNCPNVVHTFWVTWIGLFWYLWNVVHLLLRQHSSSDVLSVVIG